MDQVSRKFLSEPTAVTEERLKRLIDDLKLIRSALPGIPIRFCHEMIFKHLVGSGCFEISLKMLESVSSVVDDNGEPVLNEETVETVATSTVDVRNELWVIMDENNEEGRELEPTSEQKQDFLDAYPFIDEYQFAILQCLLKL